MGISIEAEASIYLKGAPSITSSKKQFGQPGETVQIECAAFSIPKVKHILWSHDGREINTSENDDYTIIEDTTRYGVKSTLVIHRSDAKHFGQYNCSVANDYGHDSLEILLTGMRKLIFFCYKGKIHPHLTDMPGRVVHYLSVIFFHKKFKFKFEIDFFTLSLSLRCSSNDVIFFLLQFSLIDDSHVTYVFIVLAIILFIVMVAMISVICIKSGKRKLPPTDMISEVCRT